LTPKAEYMANKIKSNYQIGEDRSSGNIIARISVQVQEMGVMNNIKIIRKIIKNIYVSVILTFFKYHHHHHHSIFIKVFNNNNNNNNNNTTTSADNIKLL
jgi:hypothetical protein